jgi:hypothetical protein
VICSSPGSPAIARISHDFLFGSGFASGHVRVDIEMPLRLDGMGTATASYSTDGGQSWTAFGTVRGLRRVRISPELGEVNLQNLRIRLTAVAGTTHTGTHPPATLHAYEVSFVTKPVQGCPCSSDTDCQDGLFCDGQEICQNSACQEGTSPCPDGLACRESRNTCELLDYCPANSTCGGQNCARRVRR